MRLKAFAIVAAAVVLGPFAGAAPTGAPTARILRGGVVVSDAVGGPSTTAAATIAKALRRIY